MRLLTLFSRLPTTLLVTSLVLAASALPVESVDSIELKVLTPDDFDSTVAEGAWFIEHFSPYCHHCRNFEPTWKKLVQHYESLEDPGVHLAQINCAANGDLCNKHDVKGYPQMNMYKNGEMVAQFKGAREWDILTTFIENHAVHSAVTEKAQEEPPVQQVQIPDTSSSSARPLPNPEGMVKALDSSTFSSTIEEGPAFVKFYAPWCGHCKKLAPIWTQLAAELRNKLTVAEVNCEVHKDLCKSQNVQGYPSLFYYSGGRGSGVHKSEYTGGRKFEQLRRFAEIATAPALLEVKSEEDYEHYVAKSPVQYLFLHAPTDKQALNQLTQASRILLGSPTILTSSISELRERFSLPAAYSTAPVLLAIKDGVVHAYTSIFAFSNVAPSVAVSKAEVAEIQEWLLRNRIPSALALTQETFQDVMSAPHHPIVVIAAISPAGEAHAADSMRSVAQAWRRTLDEKHASTSAPVRDVVYAWMDGEKWASWMKSMYGIKSSNLPTVVIADHKNLIYYDTDAKGNKISIDTPSIMNAVTDVLAGRVSYKNSENIIERTARRLNDLLIYLEEAVVAHPYRSASLLLGFLVLLFFAMKRLVSEDMPPSYADYTRNQKVANRLD